MASVQINGDVSGSVSLQAPSAAGTTVLTLPAVSGTVVTDSATQTLTNKTITSPVISGDTSISGIATIAGGVVTARGTTAAIVSGTPTTIIALSSLAAGRYNVSILVSNDAFNFGSSATIIWGGGTARIALSGNAPNSSITLSGTNIQATQLSGGTNPIKFTYVFTPF